MDKTLHGWSKNFDKINKNWVGMFEADVRSDYRKIEEYHLPSYKRKFFEAVELLEQFKKCVEQVAFDHYYIQLYPKSPLLPKYSLTDFQEIEMVKKFILEKIGDKLEQYYVLISEFETNIYGGSVMSDGYSVYIDICRGLQNQVSYGGERVFECRLQYEEISYSVNTGIFEKYIFQHVLDTLRLKGGKEYAGFLRGYFEFAVTRKEPNDDFYRIIFIDFKTDEQYYNI